MVVVYHELELRTLPHACGRWFMVACACPCVGVWLVVMVMGRWRTENGALSFSG